VEEQKERTKLLGGRLPLPAVPSKLPLATRPILNCMAWVLDQVVAHGAEYPYIRGMSVDFDTPAGGESAIILTLTLGMDPPNVVALPATMQYSGMEGSDG